MYAFISEMKEWEVETAAYYARVGQGLITDEQEVAGFKAAQREKLRHVFGRWVEAAGEPKRLRDPGIHFGTTQPIYDPAQEQLVSLVERPGGVVIETRQLHDMRQFQKYELVESAGTWKVRDNRKSRFDAGSKWRNWPL